MIEVALDGGACRHVIAEKSTPGYQVHESNASSRGLGFVVGNGGADWIFFLQDVRGREVCAVEHGVEHLGWEHDPGPDLVPHCGLSLAVMTRYPAEQDHHRLTVASKVQLAMLL